MLTVENGSKFDWKNITLKDCVKGNALDAYFTLKLFNLLRTRLPEKASLLFKSVISPAITKISDIEFKGCPVSQYELKKLDKSLRQEIINFEDFVYSKDYVNKDDNLDSPADISKILYLREEGLNLYPPDKTPKGQPSTDAATLKLLLEQINKEILKRGKME